MAEVLTAIQWVAAVVTFVAGIGVAWNCVNIWRQCSRIDRARG